LIVDCYEIDSTLSGYLREHLVSVEGFATSHGCKFASHIHERDFIEEVAFALPMGAPRYTHAILNPPYRKLATLSAHRKLLRFAGIEVVNLYAAFLGLTIELMQDGGEVVAIIPRSFCNGTYFRAFRKFLLERVSITHLHVFGSRSKAFGDDDVLQENIIIRVIRGEPQGDVLLSQSSDAGFTDYVSRQSPFANVVKPGDLERFIHIPITDGEYSHSLFSCSLQDLGVEVSTGPVVDFRLKDYWLTDPRGECAPLLYAHHFRKGHLEWPKVHKKPNALRLADETLKWLMPRGWYTVTKRFSAKEERKRLVAYVLNPEDLPHRLYGFENHLNVFHVGKKSLAAETAYGLAAFLNSTPADEYFRTFSGHTQVNATDLRFMRYPSRQSLEALGKHAMTAGTLTQKQIDDALIQVLRSG
jgi:adenine-specific DNA-methyltransferase